MRRTTILLQVTALSLAISLLPAAAVHLSVHADPANVPSLAISQIKITSSNGQFVTLYNATGSTVDLSKYQLEYFNSYDLSKATSSKLIALSGTVPPHGYYMVNDGTSLLCYQLTVDSVTLGLSSTVGLVELLGFNQAVPGGSVTPSLQDYVGWSKTAAAGARTLPADPSAFLARLPLTAQNNPAVNAAGSGTWQSVEPDPNNPCNLVSVDAAGPPPAPSGTSPLLPSSEPSATIISLAGTAAGGAAGPVLPPADKGLKAPAVTEILPNPNGTGNDATDEFAELYNPNSVPFDLTGFALQAGTRSFHKFTFPSGSVLPALGFSAFYSANTGLSQSNSGGQVQLLDPFGKSLSATAVYSTADDGQTWALANGKWYWTVTPTPGKANVVKQAAKAAAKSKSGKAPKQRATTSAGQAAGAATGDAAESSTAIMPIHPWTLALVAGLAILYLGYEYRTDLANRLYQFRSYFRARRRNRS